MCKRCRKGLTCKSARRGLSAELGELTAKLEKLEGCLEVDEPCFGGYRQGKRGRGGSCHPAAQLQREATAGRDAGEYGKVPINGLENFRG